MDTTCSKLGTSKSKAKSIFEPLQVLAIRAVSNTNRICVTKIRKNLSNMTI